VSRVSAAEAGPVTTAPTRRVERRRDPWNTIWWTRGVEMSSSSSSSYCRQFTDIPCCPMVIAAPWSTLAGFGSAGRVAAGSRHAVHRRASHNGVSGTRPGVRSVAPTASGFGSGGSMGKHMS
jgi:hypothetical protein